MDTLERLEILEGIYLDRVDSSAGGASVCPPGTIVKTTGRPTLLTRPQLSDGLGYTGNIVFTLNDALTVRIPGKEEGMSPTSQMLHGDLAVAIEQAERDGKQITIVGMREQEPGTVTAAYIKTLRTTHTYLSLMEKHVGDYSPENILRS